MRLQICMQGKKVGQKDAEWLDFQVCCVCVEVKPRI